MSTIEAAHGEAFRVFLSHRYKSPEVNEYFFRIFSATANPQFAVDRGTIPTNVTRLERLIRAADAFIGIYHFSADAEPTVEQLRRQSQYFRLELDLAERAGKPALVFVDSRFGNVIVPPPDMIQVRFKHEEIASHAQSPREHEFKTRFSHLCDRVTASRAYNFSRLAEEDKTKVGILLPGATSSVFGYTEGQIELIESAINQEAARDVEVLRWPPVLDGRLAARLDAFDWIAVDIGDASTACGIVGYLHGRFIPTMRLLRVPEGTPPGGSGSLAQTLFGAYEVGYPKDIVRWIDDRTLEAELRARVKVVYAPQKQVATLAEAQQYFRSAALRNEAVFVSYSGQDQDIAAELIAALKQRFQQVFDYRAAGQIRAGALWRPEISKQLAKTAIGVPLFSRSYFNSPNCQEEVQQMLTVRDAGNMKIVPIKLEKDFDLPLEVNQMQYLRLWLEPDPNKMVEAIIGSTIV